MDLVFFLKNETYALAFDSARLLPLNHTMVITLVNN